MSTVAVGLTVEELCLQARDASRELALLDSASKDSALGRIAVDLRARIDQILSANELDMQAGRRAGLDDALLDRLALSEDRIREITDAVEDVAALADPVGEVIEGRRLANGLSIRRVRVPLGVIGVVYEARPNVTIDATALCLKSGNAIILRGSSAARHSNMVLATIASEAAVSEGLPRGSVSLLACEDHSDLAVLATQTKNVDLIIPRGGEALKAALKEVATVPVIFAASGNCHIYVDRRADLDQAERIVINAKVQRPGVCNSAEKLLVHSDVAARFLPRIVASLARAGVALRGDERARSLAPAQYPVAVADEEDWASEYLSLRMAIAVVDGIEQAVDHISRYGSGHSEAIVTRDTRAARAFQLGVDAACVYVNASTRFTDGGQFGMGAEIGNSTQKLHARGPIGLRELCAVKYLIEGEGQIRT